MTRSDVQKMLADGKRYESIRPKQPYAPLPWPLQMIILVLVVYALSSCT